MYAFFSLFMTTVFQLAHMVEKTQTPALSQDNSISNERAVHEVVTTSNFAMKNKFITWLL
jgi:linoleoyl-CoA desaturase